MLSMFIEKPKTSPTLVILPRTTVGESVLISMICCFWVSFFI